MLRARERKALKLFSAARELEYRKRRACRTWAVKMSVGVGDDGGDGVTVEAGAGGVGLGTAAGAGVSVG